MCVIILCARADLLPNSRGAAAVRARRQLVGRLLLLVSFPETGSRYTRRFHQVVPETAPRSPRRLRTVWFEFQMGWSCVPR